MRVIHLSFRHALKDVRIYKECNTLAEAGHEVHHIAPNWKSEAFKAWDYKTTDTVKLHGIKVYNKESLKSKSATKIIKEIPAVFRTFYEICKKASTLNGDIYHYHDPEIFPIALYLKLIRRKKVVYDMHEHAPKQILQIPIPKPLKYMLLVVYTIFDFIAENYFDAGVQVIMAKKFKNAIIVENYVELPTKYDRDYSKKEDVTIIYVGGLTRLRGIKELVKAMEYANGKLWLAGNWQSGLLGECTELDGWEKCTYLGVLKFDEVPKYLKKADIGVIPHMPAPNHNVGHSIKSYEYLGYGLPMVMTEFGLWKQDFEKCALFFNPKNPKDIANKINLLVENPLMRESLGNHGRKLIEDKYNWGIESKKLIELYNKMEEKNDL